jgi:hypothetical protein
MNKKIIGKSFIRIVTPDSNLWSDQEHFVRLSDIRALRLVRKMNASASPENGVEVLLTPETYARWTHRYWIRCPSFDAARELYESIVAQLLGFRQ